MSKVFHAGDGRLRSSGRSGAFLAGADGGSGCLSGSARAKLTVAAICGLVMLGLPLPAQAQTTRNWDANGGPTGNGNGGTGTWNTTGLNWTLSTTGATPHTAWNNAAGDNAIFRTTAGTVTLGVPITAHNLTFQGGGYTLTGSTLTLVGATPTISTTSGTTTIDSIIAGTAGLTKIGNGILVLNGANTFSGGIAVNGGSLYVNGSGAFGDPNNDLAMAGGTTLRNTSATTLTVTGNVALTGASGSTTTFNAFGGGLELLGVISGDPGRRVTLSGSAGMTIVLGDANTYDSQTGISGGVIVEAGVLANTGVASSFGTGTDASNTIFAAGGTLSYTGAGASTNRAFVVSQNGTFANNGSGALSLTGVVLLQSVNGTFGGSFTGVNVIANAISGTGNLIVDTAGTWALAGDNVYTGTTTITTGTLQLGDGGTSGSVLGDITNNSMLAFNRSDVVTLGGVVSGAGIVRQLGTGTTVLSGVNTYTGATVIEQGVLQAGSTSAFGNNSAVTLADVAGATLDLNGFSNTVGSLAGGGSTGGNVTLGAGTLTTGGNNTSTIFGGIISGAGGLVKTGTGIQVLMGDNTYTGGTTINAGTLQIGNGGATGSIVGNVTNNATLAFNRSDAVTYSGVISGGGTNRQIGSGLVNLTGNSSGFAGTTSIEAGTLAVNGSLCGAMNVLSGGTLQGTGTVCDTTNFAGGTVAPGNSIGTITVAGNYTGVGGTLEIEAILGSDASPTDLLHVTGNTSGPTNVQVINLGGAGAQTVEGIRIVQVDGVSAGAFALLGDYVFEGDQAVVGGAYAYRLYQGGTSTPADGDWYLRSDLIPGDPSAGPLLQPGAPLYESYANVLQSFNRLRTMQQRVGNRSWGPGVIETETSDGLVEHHGIWGQIEATRASFDPATSTTGANYDLNLWKLYAGMDGLLLQNEEGSLVGGMTVAFGTVSASVSSPMGAGTINAQGYSLGGALTWHGTDGLYVDGQAQATFYTTDIFSSTAGRALVQGNGGFGYGLSIEAGQQIELGSNWSVTPQAQLAYSDVSASFNDAFGAPVTLEQGDSLIGRLGLSVDYEVEDEDTRTHFYGIANIYYDLAGDMVTDLAGLDLVQRNDPLRGGVGVGGSYNWDGDKYSIFGEASVVTSLTNPASGHALNGNVGFRVRW